jgi:hypothetical protein
LLVISEGKNAGQVPFGTSDNRNARQQAITDIDAGQREKIGILKNYQDFHMQTLSGIFVVNDGRNGMLS